MTAPRDPAPASGHVEVDTLLCQGTGYCVTVCPDVFVLDAADGLARARAPTVAPELLDAAEEAEQLCPTGAIRLRRPAAS